MPNSDTTKRCATRVLAGLIVLAITLPPLSAAGDDCKCRAQVQHYPDEIFPPWQKGENNDALDRGVDFTIPQIDSLADFHGDLTDPKLVLFVGGNYFFAMAPLVKTFEQLHPEYKGRIYWETIPPGLLVKQIRNGGTITSGNMTWIVKADAYFAGLMKVKELIDDGLLVAPAVPYVTNTLTIMVPRTTRRTSRAWRIWAGPRSGWRCQIRNSRELPVRSKPRCKRRAAKIWQRRFMRTR